VNELLLRTLPVRASQMRAWEQAAIYRNMFLHRAWDHHAQPVLIPVLRASVCAWCRRAATLPSKHALAYVPRLMAERSAFYAESTTLLACRLAEG